jgi:hypothetical protein
VTVVEGRYFPATVRFPTGSLWRRVYVVIARNGDHDGLHIWRQPRDDPDFRAAVDWTRTHVPRPRQARNGVDVYTDQGLVIVTSDQGCRCGQLARWAGPTWAHTVKISA